MMRASPYTIYTCHSCTNLPDGSETHRFDLRLNTSSRLRAPIYSLTVSHNGLYGKVGTFSDDFDGTYYEAGYGRTLTVSDTDLFDYAIALIHSESTLLGGKSDTNLVFSLSKTFQIH